MSVMGTVYDLERDKALGIDRDSLLAENARLRAEVDRMHKLTGPLTQKELRLVDKNCDWIAFSHAWNAVMRSRREQITG